MKEERSSLGLDGLVNADSEHPFESCSTELALVAKEMGRRAAYSKGVMR